MNVYERYRFWLVDVPSHDDFALADFLSMVDLSLNRGIYALDWSYDPKRGNLGLDFGEPVSKIAVCAVCAAALPDVPCPDFWALNEERYCVLFDRAALEG